MFNVDVTNLPMDMVNEILSFSHKGAIRHGGIFMFGIPSDDPRYEMLGKTIRPVDHSLVYQVDGADVRCSSITLPDFPDNPHKHITMEIGAYEKGQRAVGLRHIVTLWQYSTEEGFEIRELSNIPI
jgi:hypothetical protein